MLEKLQPLLEPDQDDTDGSPEKTPEQIVDETVDQIIKTNNFALLDKVDISLHSIIALKLIDERYVWPVAKNLDKFRSLNKEIPLKLIEEKEGSSVVYYFDQFNDLDQADQEEITIKLIEARESDTIKRNLDNFKYLNKKIALKFIEVGEGEIVLKNLDNFVDIDREVIIKLLAVVYDCDLEDFLDRFPDLVFDKELALVLINCRKPHYVAGHFWRFKDLDPVEISNKLFELNYGYYVLVNLNQFNGLNHTEVALKLLEAGEVDNVEEYFDQFEDLSKTVALKLIQLRKVYLVTDYIRTFYDLDGEVALAIIEAGGVETIIENFYQFKDLDQKVALRLIEERLGGFVLDHLDEFNDLDYTELVIGFLEMRENELLLDNIDKFKDMGKKAALKFIELGWSYWVMNNLDKFKDLDKEVAFSLIEAGSSSDFTVDNLERFQGLTKEELSNFFKEAGELGLKAGEYYIFHTDEAKKERLKEFKDEEEKYEYIYSQLIETNKWSDERNIIKPFESGAQAFGYRKMFEYLNRKGLTRHDGLHNFQAIFKMLEASGLKPQEFFNNILIQVVKDDSDYGDLNNAHIKLNTIASNVNFSLVEAVKVMEKAKEYPDVQKLQELVQDLSLPEKIFESWKNLKKFEELNQLLQKTYILDELQGLNRAGKKKLYSYIETLAFHPNISMDAVLEFWRDPAAFLGVGDLHTTEEVQDRKKPSNYTSIPNLDLTAEELRDALVEGVYDYLQVIKPLSVVYEIPRELPKQVLIVDFKDLFLRAVGSRKDDKKGEARDPKKAFSEIGKLFEKYKLNIQEFLSAADYQEYLTTNLKSEQVEEFFEKFSQLVYDNNFGLIREAVFDEYRAKINLKSDPDGVVAGNDTACCMPFGSGKNNVYTFNPICSLFTIQKRNSDGVWRTIAQSVLTKDKEIDKNISTLVSEMQQSYVKMQDLVGEEAALIQQPSVIACDNIEVAQNFKSNPRQEEILKYIYLNFFKEYLAKFAKEDHLDEGRVIIGEGYSDSLTSLPRVDNHFVPEAPVGYSDNLHPTSFLLNIKEAEKNLGAKRKINFDSIKKLERTPIEQPTLPRGLSSLTFTDSLSVAYIEGKAYADNQSLMAYLHNMENALIAKDVNNEAKDRPNLSLKYQDSKGKMRGYILAYEGLVDEYVADEDYDEDDIKYSPSEIYGERVIYVSDLASDGSMKSGGLLMKGFIELYKKHYIDKNDFVPIYAQLREQTSYKLIVSNLADLSKAIGYELEIDELRVKNQGGDRMYEVIIYPKV